VVGGGRVLDERVGTWNRNPQFSGWVPSSYQTRTSTHRASSCKQVNVSPRCSTVPRGAGDRYYSTGTPSTSSTSPDFRGNCKAKKLGAIGQSARRAPVLGPAFTVGSNSSQWTGRQRCSPGRCQRQESEVRRVGVDNRKNRIWRCNSTCESRVCWSCRSARQCDDNPRYSSAYHCIIRAQAVPRGETTMSGRIPSAQAQAPARNLSWQTMHAPRGLHRLCTAAGALSSSLANRQPPTGG